MIEKHEMSHHKKQNAPRMFVEKKMLFAPTPKNTKLTFIIIAERNVYIRSNN